MVTSSTGTPSTTASDRIEQPPREAPSAGCATRSTTAARFVPIGPWTGAPRRSWVHLRRESLGVALHVEARLGLDAGATTHGLREVGVVEQLDDRSAQR